jgi:hypothetical protein
MGIGFIDYPTYLCWHLCIVICTSSEHLGQMGQFTKVWFPGL